MKRIILLFLLLTLPAYSGELLTGKVVRVIDGDTIEVNLKTGTARVRLYGIDAPEHSQPYGEQATRYLRQLLQGREIEVYSVCLDKYKRYLAKIYYNDKYINLMLVKSGLAWAYSAGKQNFEIKLAQRYAKQHHIGLWHQAKPIRPSTYRKHNK